MSNLIRFFFPTATERQIARRYLYSGSKRPIIEPRRFLTWKVGLILIVGLLSAFVEIAYFGLGHTSAALAIFAIALPFLFSLLLLLHFFSVFSTVAITGVSVGVATLIVVLSVASGFIQEVSQRLTGMYADLFLTKTGYHLDPEEYHQFLQELRSSPKIAAVAPYVRKEMFVSKMGWPPIGIFLEGIDLQEAPKVIQLNQWLLPIEGSLPQISSLGQLHVPSDGGPALPAIFLGDILVRRLQLKIGDKIQLLNLEAVLNLPEKSSDSHSNAQPTLFYSQEFYLAGIIYTGYEKLDRQLGCISFPEAQKILGMGDIASGIEIRLKDPATSKEVSRSLLQIFGSNYSINNPQKDNIVEALKIQRSALSLVIFLIILVASFNVIASLTILVIHKVRGIAILKTMGIPPWGIAAIFRTIGINVGIFGTGLGAGLGLLICMIVRRLHYTLEARIYLINHLPVQISLYEICGAVIATLLICSLATLYPALRAAHLQPVDGLRQE